VHQFVEAAHRPDRPAVAEAALVVGGEVGREDVLDAPLGELVLGHPVDDAGVLGERGRGQAWGAQRQVVRQQLEDGDGAALARRDGRHGPADLVGLAHGFGDGVADHGAGPAADLDPDPPLP
jgi:hypothetical protein